MGLRVIKKRIKTSFNTNKTQPPSINILSGSSSKYPNLSIFEVVPQISLAP
jgi:hypothetical protein